MEWVSERGFYALTTKNERSFAIYNNSEETFLGSDLIAWVDYADEDKADYYTIVKRLPNWNNYSLPTFDERLYLSTRNFFTFSSVYEPHARYACIVCRRPKPAFGHACLAYHVQKKKFRRVQKIARLWMLIARQLGWPDAMTQSAASFLDQLSLAA